MLRDGSDRAGLRRARVWSVAGAALALAPLLAGCTTNAYHGVGGATVAFESIAGPPRPVFDQLVAQLDAEARSRQVAVVSRTTPARYRVRAYLAAKVERRRTSITWVWDVYDSDLRRAMRIAGEEQIGRRVKDAWAAADDRLLGRIAETGMTQLAAFAAGRDAAPPDGEVPQAAPGPAGPPPETPAGDIRVAAAAAPQR
jgi:hypothetical protein